MVYVPSTHMLPKATAEKVAKSLAVLLRVRKVSITVAAEQMGLSYETLYLLNRESRLSAATLEKIKTWGAHPPRSI